MGSVVEFTKGWLGVQPGPRIFLLSSGRIGIPDEKNDCERTRKQWTVISKPSSPADQRQPCQSHGSGKSEDWVGGLCPPDPPRFTALFQARRANKNGTPCGIPSPILAPSRRSGRVSASPYPPLGSLTSVLLGGTRNQTECARWASGQAYLSAVRRSSREAPFRTYYRSNRVVCARPTRSWSVVFPGFARFGTATRKTAAAGDRDPLSRPRRRDCHPTSSRRVGKIFKKFHATS